MLENRMVLVTGGSRGIGAAVCRCVANYGAAVAINYNASSEAAEELAHSIVEEGARAITVKADVSSESDVSFLVERTVSEFGRIDGLVNNAGISRHKLFREMDVSDWDEIMNTNLRSMFLCSHAARPHLAASRQGKIVNNSSMLEFVSRRNLSAYTAAKAGVGGLTRALALELAEEGIQVNSVCPGVIETEILGDRIEKDKEFRDSILSLIPAGRLGRADEVADIFAFLLSDRSDYITGASIPIDGGMIAARV